MRQNKMPVSFRTAKNLGLGIFLAIIIIISLFSYTTLHWANSQLKKIVFEGEVKLSQYAEIAEHITDAKDYLADYINGKMGVISGFILNLDDLSSHLELLKDLSLSPQELRILAEIEEELKSFKGSVFAYKKEIDDGNRGSTSAQELERIALDSSANITQLIRAGSQAVREDITRKHRSIIVHTDITQRFLAVSLLATIILVFVVSLLMMHALSYPVRQLFKATKEISKGNLDYKIELISSDEFGLIATSFNQMASSLKKAEEEREKSQTEKIKMIEELKTAKNKIEEYSWTLENKVTERTRDLMESIKESDEHRRAIANMLEDINESHQKLTRANQELKETQAKLIQSAKMAAVGQLAGGVAHEINNPLTGVLNNVQLIKLEVQEREKCGVSEVKDILDAIEESALRCKRIVRSLLDFSRVSKSVYWPVAVNEIIEKTLLLAEVEIKLENIRIIRELSENLPLVMADSNRLQQAFLDIINNAVWALKEKGGGDLRIKTEAGSDDKSASIIFSDTGCGIAPENLPRIFEPFFTTKKTQEGTGLGLSISYGIIKAHNGKIEVSSEGKDKGAAFKVTLPAIGALPI